MTTFIGDYTCKVDPKGRIMLPQAFKKNMPEVARDKFVIKKDIYEKCLVLYPLDEWQRRIQTILGKQTIYLRRIIIFQKIP